MTTSNRPDVLSPRKLALQLVGFAVGIGLLGWCIRGAAGPDTRHHWEQLFKADWRLVALMLGATLISMVVNGTIFWVTVRGLRHLRFGDLQWINFAGGLLNYFPVRLGAIMRVTHHVRIDRLSLLQVGAWFTFIAYTLGVGAGACLVATLMRDRLDGLWAAMVVGMVIVGGVLTRVIVGSQLLKRYGQGADRLLAHRSAVWMALALRMVDLAAFAVRMGVAASILDFQLRPDQIVILAIVAYGANLVPFGRVGVREFCVAQVAARLSLAAGDVHAKLEPLALLDSAAEAALFIPFGIMGILWMRAKWKSVHSRT